MPFVRYESAVPNSRGTHPGIFGVANGLARSGQLSTADRTWWRESNDWYTAAYCDPATVDPSLFHKARHPGATCWFRGSADHLLCRLPGYLTLLDRYGVAWRERRSADPGVIHLRRCRPGRRHSVPAGSGCRVIVVATGSESRLRVPAQSCR